MVGDAEPAAAEPRLQKGDSLKRIHAADGGASPDGGRSPPGQKGAGAAKWANAKNAVKGANAFSDGGFRQAARQKLRGTEHGWIGGLRGARARGARRASRAPRLTRRASLRPGFSPLPLSPHHARSQGHPPRAGRERVEV